MFDLLRHRGPDGKLIVDCTGNQLAAPVAAYSADAAAKAVSAEAESIVAVIDLSAVALREGRRSRLSQLTSVRLRTT